MTELEEHQLALICEIPHLGYTIQDGLSDDVTLTGQSKVIYITPLSSTRVSDVRVGDREMAFQLIVLIKLSCRDEVH